MPVEQQLNTTWIASNVEPLHRVLPKDSPLHAGLPLLDRLVYACSNTEFKPALLFLGLNEFPTEKGIIYKRVGKFLPASFGSSSQPHNVVRLLRNFMCPVGLVQEVDLHYFATTTEGETIGKDTAAFLLGKAVDLVTPVGPVLQERSEDDRDNPTRAYITRMATLIALRTTPLTQVKLFEKMGGSLQALVWNLRVLSARKLIIYDAVDTQIRGQYIYERANLSLVPNRAGVITRNVANYFERNEQGNNYTIAAALKMKSVHYIGKILKQLTRVGAIKPVGWESRDHQSDASITPLGERFVDELIIPLLLAYSGDEQGLQMLAQARKRLEDDPTIATDALDQYKRQRVLIPEAETKEAIVSFVQLNGPIRRREIVGHIGNRCHPQLIELVKEGKLKTVRDGNASFYMLANAADQPVRTEEVKMISFNPPELFDVKVHGTRAKYRAELDTIEFWQNLHRELQNIGTNRYTLRDFFLKYHPEHPDWPHGYDSGIFSKYVRALTVVGIQIPWEFIRTYQPMEVPAEVSKAITIAQRLMNRVFPVDVAVNHRLFNRRYMVSLETPGFWQELAADVLSVPKGIKIESFLLRFDPNEVDKLKPGHRKGKYSNLRAQVRIHAKKSIVTLLTEYRPPASAPVGTWLAVRETQALLREHLLVRHVGEDDFADIAQLRKRQEEEIKKKQEASTRLSELKAFYERFGEFSKAEMAVLATTTAERVHTLRSNVKGHDVDEASFTSIDFRSIKDKDGAIFVDIFPIELKVAYLIFAFEQWRTGGDLPKISENKEQRVFLNGDVKNSLAVLEKYLTYYENQAKKKDPNAVLPASTLIKQLKKYIFAV